VAKSKHASNDGIYQGQGAEGDGGLTFTSSRRLFAVSLHMTRLGQDGLRATLSDVTVILGERRLQLTRAEAKELHDQLVERNLAVLALQSELNRAMEADSARLRWRTPTASGCRRR
jgi:hypothetical protein